MSLKFFQNAFPPPKFLDMSYAGISVSDNYIRCIKFVKKNKEILIESFCEKEVPLGSVVSGAIKDITQVSNILMGIKKELGLDIVRVSLTEENTYLFNTKIPKVNPSEIRSAIEFKMEENVPVSIEDLFFDYIVTTPNGHDDHLDVVVSALPKKIVNDYIETFEKAGLSVISLEIESQAMARALLPKNYDKTTLIINFDGQKVGLYVASSGIVHFTSTLLIKEDSLDDLQSLTNEIKKLYIYWHTLKENAGVENKKITNIIVCGGGGNEEIVSYLSNHIKSNTLLANVWINAFDINTVIPIIPFKQSLSFTPAVGLALPQDRLL